MQPTKRQIANGTYKRGVDSRWYKRCTGPAHAMPEYLPANDKYFTSHRSGSRVGQLLSRCRLCVNWAKLKSPGSHHGYVDIRDALPFYIEAVNRVGIIELALRSGVSASAIQNVLNGSNSKYVKKLTLRKIMLELVSMQRKGEHNNSKGLLWRRDRRNARHMNLCPGCGTPRSNATAGCIQCWDRWYDYWRQGKITSDEWKQQKNLLSR